MIRSPVDAGELNTSKRGESQNAEEISLAAALPVTGYEIDSGTESDDETIEEHHTSGDTGCEETWSELSSGISVRSRPTSQTSSESTLLSLELPRSQLPSSHLPQPSSHLPQPSLHLPQPYQPHPSSFPPHLSYSTSLDLHQPSCSFTPYSNISQPYSNPIHPPNPPLYPETLAEPCPNPQTIATTTSALTSPFSALKLPSTSGVCERHYSDLDDLWSALPSIATNDKASLSVQQSMASGPTCQDNSQEETAASGGPSHQDQSISSSTSLPKLPTRRMRSLRSNNQGNMSANFEETKPKETSSSTTTTPLVPHHYHHYTHRHHLRSGGALVSSSTAADEECEECDDVISVGCSGECEECNVIENHSSEEELETLTGSWPRENTGPTEKRKWSQVARLSLTDSGSSDEEGHFSSESRRPLQFRTTPPLEVHKPPLQTVSPPTKMIGLLPSPRGLKVTENNNNREDRHCLKVEGAPGSNEAKKRAASPRKRHRHGSKHPSRPSLDFEKMQQIKNNAVTQWRNSGELSLSFC